MVYFIPARYGLGELSARRRRRRRRRHLEIQVDILAGELHLEFSNWNSTHMTDIRISRRIYLAEWLGLGSHFRENAELVVISNTNVLNMSMC